MSCQLYYSKTDRKKKMEEKTVETSRQVYLPVEIPYDIIAGGACRDCLCGDEPSDYDIFFSDKSKYIEALKVITERPDMKCVTTRAGAWLGIKNSLLRWEEKTDNSVIKYDLILCDADLDKVIEHIINGFDFTVNCCFQKQGGLVNSHKDALPLYKEKNLELNCERISLVRLLNRIKHLNKKGWIAGSSTIQFCFDRITKMIKEPDSFIEEEKDFIENTGGYSRENYVNQYKLWDEFFPVVEDEHLILGFLSDSDIVLEATRKQYEKRKKKAERDAKGGFIQRIGDFIVSLEDPKTTKKQEKQFEYVD